MKYINSPVFSLGLAVAIPAVVMADMAIHEGLAKRSNPSTTTQSSSTQTPSTTTYVPATQTPYGQCGGVGYTGPIICPPGWSCYYANEYHSQCLQATASSTTSSSSSSTSSSIVSSTSPPSSSSTSSPTSTSTSPPISSSSTTTTTTGLPSRAYAQCNGIGYTGPTTCPPGWSCHEANVYVWQCLIGTITSTSTTTTSILPTQTPYGQCGGIGYTGLITCAPGWTCNHLNAYFFQCVPS